MKRLPLEWPHHVKVFPPHLFHADSLLSVDSTAPSNIFDVLIRLLRNPRRSWDISVVYIRMFIIINQ